jgi:serine/threonine protein kinase
MEFDPGTRLGPYEVKAALGAGGMGEVYRAVDTRLDREVAIKVLPRELAEDSLLRQRLQREARAMGLLLWDQVAAAAQVLSKAWTLSSIRTG